MSFSKRLRGAVGELGRAADQLSQGIARFSSLERLERSIPRSPEAFPHEREECEAPDWDAIVDGLQHSASERHRSQIFLGFHAGDDYPVLLPFETLREHGHITGGTGTGKTSRAVLPLITQLLRHPDPEHRGPIFVIDLKGERYLFNAVRREAERNGRPFKYLTNVAGLPSYAFNPILDLRTSGLTDLQIGESLRAAMNLEHGTAYGAQYFSALTRGYLHTLIERFPNTNSFRELDTRRIAYKHPDRREEYAERELSKQAYELTSLVQILAKRDELNVTTKAVLESPNVYSEEVLRGRIDSSTALEEDHVVYFFLNAKREESIARVIASLALECLYTACVRRNIEAASPRTKPAYAFIDEFQIVAGRNFQIFMQQARFAGLPLVLSNQSRQDLAGTPLMAAVDENTGFRTFFSFRTPEAQRYIRDLSGDTERLWDKGRWLEGEGTELRLGPRFNVNELNAISASDGIAFVVQAKNRDYSQYDGFPTPVFAPYHIDKRTFLRLKEESWPEPEPGTVVIRAEGGTKLRAPVAASPPSQSDTVAPEPRTIDIERPKEGTDLARLFSRIEVGHDRYKVHD